MEGVTGIAGCMPVAVRDQNGHINCVRVDQIRLPPPPLTTETDRSGSQSPPGEGPLSIWNGDFWEPILGVRKLGRIGDAVWVYSPAGILCASPGLKVVGIDITDIPCGSLRKGVDLSGVLDPIFREKDPDDPTRMILSVPPIPEQMHKVRWSGMNKLLLECGIPHTLPYMGAKPEKVELLMADREKARFFDRNIIQCMTETISADEAWLFGLWAGNCRNQPNYRRPHSKWCIVLHDLKVLTKAQNIASAMYAGIHFYIVDRMEYGDEYNERMPREAEEGDTEEEEDVEEEEGTEGESGYEADEEEEVVPSPAKRRKGVSEEVQAERARKAKERAEKVIANRAKKRKQMEGGLKRTFHVLAVHAQQRDVFTELWKGTLLSTTREGKLAYTIHTPILNAPSDVKRSFIDGLRANVAKRSWARLYGSEFAKGVYTMARSVGIGIRLELVRTPVDTYRFKINATSTRYYPWKVDHIENEKRVEVAIYHISTESGQVVAGVGALLCHFNKALN